MSTEIVYTSGVSKPYRRVTHYIMIAVPYVTEYIELQKVSPGDSEKYIISQVGGVQHMYGYKEKELKKKSERKIKL